MVREGHVPEYEQTDQHHTGPGPAVHCGGHVHVHPQLLRLCWGPQRKYMPLAVCEYDWQKMTLCILYIGVSHGYKCNPFACSPHLKLLLSFISGFA